MIYPTEFFYSISKSQKSYHVAPVGQPDIIRSIDHEDFWMMPEIQSAKRPKTLIIHQPDVTKWTTEYTFQAIQYIKQCLNDGFTVYLWQNNALQAVTIDTITGILLDDRIRSNLIHSNLQTKISDVAADNKISSDSCLILTVDKLFEYFQGQTCTVALQKSLVMDNQAFESAPTDESIADLKIEFSKPLEINDSSLFSKYPNLARLKFYVDDDRYVTSLLVNKLENNFNELLEISFDGTIIIALSSMINLLLSSPKLRTLSISVGNNIFNDLPEDWQAPPELMARLENLTFKETQKYCPAFFISILSNMKQLKKLDLRILNDERFCEILLTHIKPEQWKSLEVFRFESDKSLDARILNRLTQARRLEELYINIFGEANSNPIIPKDSLSCANYIPALSFPNLKRFSWMAGQFNIRSFLNGAVQLESIEVRKCDFSLPEISSVYHLKKLLIHHTDIFTKHLETVLIHNPFLETVTLSSSSLSDDLKLPKGILKHVKTLELSMGMDITQASLENILKACPNLEVLDIDFIEEDTSIEKALAKCPEFKNLKITSHGDLRFTKETFKSQSSLEWDADTKPIPTSFIISKIFSSINPMYSDPDVHFYRVNVFNQLHLNPNICDKNVAFNLRQTGDLQLKDVNLPAYAPNLYDYAFSATMTLELKANQWQSLPSLTANDEIYEINLPSDVELKYSKRDHLYYIRCNTDKLFNCQFKMIVKPLFQQQMPEGINALIQEISAFEAKELVLSPSIQYTGVEYIEALHQQKVGACRHRAMVFKYLMDKNFPEFACRIISNTSHAFVEFSLNGQWLIVNLGGYPGEVSILEPPEIFESVSVNPFLSAKKITWSAEDEIPRDDLSPKKIFSSLDEKIPDPEPATYRINIFNHLQVGEYLGWINCFHLTQDDDLQLEDISLPPDLNKGYLASIEIDLKAFVWQALPSLTPNDEIYQISLPQHIQLKYSQKNQMYYVLSDRDERYHFYFKLQHKITKAKKIPDDIQQLVRKLHQYETGKLEIDTSEDYTGAQFLEMIQDQQVGSSCQRAIILKHYLDNNYPHSNSRIVTSECHAFVEAQIEGVWMTFDLGDRPKNLEVVLDNPKLRELSKKAFSTWMKEKKEPMTPAQFLATCLNQQANKLLIEADNIEQTKALRRLFLSHRSEKQPIFYIHSADDIKCASKFMKKFADGHGELMIGPGGPLHDFLTKHHQGILLINYANFKPADLVKFNALLDDTRCADGTPIPKDVIIIGLINTDRPMPGSDFYSRFAKIQTCPIDTSEIPGLSLPNANRSASDAYTIDFFHSNQWKSIMVGNWCPSRSGWHFKDGEFQKAYNQGVRSFEWRNAPWDNEDFVQFYEESILNSDIQVFVQSGYNWQGLIEALEQPSQIPQQPIFILNPLTMSQLFQKYIVQGSDLVEQPGLIKSAQGKKLSLLNTHPISEHDWAKLLNEAKINGVQLEVFKCDELALPDSLAQAPISRFNPLASNENTIMIQSDDADLTIQTIDAEDAIVLHIDESHSSDLISRIDLKIQDLQFRFSESVLALQNLLDEGKTVILTGHCRLELAMELESYLLERFYDNAAKGRLYAIFSEAPFSFIYPHQINHQRKEPKCIEMAKQIYQSAFPDKDPENAWLGLEHLPQEHLYPSIDISNSEQQSQEFFLKRHQQVSTMLKYAPYVFIAGLSGVGKTTFIRNELAHEDIILYQNESQISEWAQSSEPGLKVLFLDEANLSSKQWTEFEGLYNTPPGILIDGQYIQLTDQHKVIFAGNPVNYGDERQLSTFFKRHGNTIIFDPLPGAVIYEKILKPVFENSKIEDSQYICEHILKAYQFICIHSAQEVLITPRELQMIALLVRNYIHNHPSEPHEAVVRYFTFQLIKDLVPIGHQASFAEQFKSEHVLQSNISLSNFLITPSRIPIVNMLEQFLDLRTTRQQSNQEDCIKNGGLGGLILEGPPGVGKTELVINSLIALGFKQAHDFETPDHREKIFYRLPINMDLDIKEKLLLKAFNEGAMVVIDEMNSSPMMERLLNNLLMGKNQSGKSPEKPGFMIIATQNPISMSGRRSASPALLRRMLTIELPKYKAEELLAIAKHQGLAFDEAQAIVEEFTKKVTEATEHGYEPIPTFRDFLKFIKWHQQAQRPQLSSTHPINIELLSIIQNMEKEVSEQRELKIIEAMLNQIDYAPEHIEMFKNIISQIQKYAIPKNTFSFWQISYEKRLEQVLEKIDSHKPLIKL